MRRLRLLTLALLAVLSAACSPSETDTLPTLARVADDLTPRASAVVPREDLPIITRTLSPTPPTNTPTVTVTPSLTITPTPTFTPSLTITPSPSPTFTWEPTVTPEPGRPLTGLLALAVRATILPTDYVIPDFGGPDIPIYTPTPRVENGVIFVPSLTPLPVATSAGTVNDIDCAYWPPGGFGTLFSAQATLRANLGCPAGNPPDVLQLDAAVQRFERGFMLWLNQTPPRIYALYNEGSRFESFEDRYADAPVTPQAPPEPRLSAPISGFGGVWRTFNQVQGFLGWAVQPETGSEATYMRFERGFMVWLTARPETIWVLYTSGTWQSFLGQF